MIIPDKMIKPVGKILLYLFPVLLSGLGSCTEIEPGAKDDYVDEPVVTNFLSIILTEASNSYTRADFNNFEDGLKSENAVKSVRFYFFDEDGNSIHVKNNGGTNSTYLDWKASEESDTNEADPETSGESQDKNIEKKLSVNLTIRTPAGEKLPESVIAVINPLDLETTGVSGLEDLNEVTGNFKITSQQPYFVISNTVYADQDSDELFEAVDIRGNLNEIAEEAAAHPAIIYVERANAKVRLKIGSELTRKGGNITLTDGTVIYNTDIERPDASSDSEENNNIYVRFLGWNVTCEPTKSYLMKNIDPTWTNVKLFGSNSYNWTNTEYYRSHWAINPLLVYDEDNSDYQFGDFAYSQAIKGFGLDDKVNYTYTLENASETKDKPTAHPTQVIVAAQLTDSKGRPCEVAEWGSTIYTKADLLTNLANLANVYEITKIYGDEEKGEDPETVVATEYHKLNEGFYKFVSRTEAGKDNDENGRYFAYLQLDENVVKDKKLTLSSGGAEMDIEEINIRLANEIAPSMIWTNGYTYYFFSIDHLQILGEEGETQTSVLGVVRNNIYDATIISLTSLGTPVFKEDDVIIPEKPKEDIFIAARINTILWRLASKTVHLEW